MTQFFFPCQWFDFDKLDQFLFMPIFSFLFYSLLFSSFSTSSLNGHLQHFSTLTTGTHYLFVLTRPMMLSYGNQRLTEKLKVINFNDKYWITRRVTRLGIDWKKKKHSEKVKKTVRFRTFFKLFLNIFQLLLSINFIFKFLLKICKKFRRFFVSKKPITQMCPYVITW